VPELFEKVWGGERLSRFGKRVARGARIGESWEVADMASTSASGAGGGAVVSRIANGAMAGRSLHDAVVAWGSGLVGEAGGGKAGAGGTGGTGGRFPLLVKFLDARENLSVQVHPSAAYAAGHPGAHLKTECWYVLDAEPGSRIYAGVKAGISAGEFARLVRAGRVIDALESHEAVAGQCFNLPSGTVHALGAGVVVAEVQTPSDTTFRVDDWGRTGRALHVEEALACAEVGPAPAAIVLGDGRGDGRGGVSDAATGGVLTTAYFEVARARVGANPWPLNAGEASPGAGGGARAGRCAVVMTLAGSGTLEAPGCEPIALEAGTTCVVPAAVRDVRLHSATASGHAAASGSPATLDALVARV
jgi:mannose-6-phosphate isomerase